MIKWQIPVTKVISHQEARILMNQEAKSCPNRMIDGQYGGFSLFYKEIKKCFETRDLFYEVIMEKYDRQNTIDEFVETGMKLKKELN